MSYRSPTMPMTTGEITSPKAWMTKMLSAKPAARIDGCVTLARIVFVGPVLKKRQKQVTKSQTQISRKGRAQRQQQEREADEHRDARDQEVRARETGARSLSPARPPASVATRPATQVMPPKITVADAGAPGRRRGSTASRTRCRRSRTSSPSCRACRRARTACAGARRSRATATWTGASPAVPSGWPRGGSFMKKAQRPSRMPGRHDEEERPPPALGVDAEQPRAELADRRARRRRRRARSRARCRPGSPCRTTPGSGRAARTG